MELQQLRYFLELCDYMNFTSAASALYVTQQALSRSIRNLERELGIKLFIRSPKGLELTYYGVYYLKCVREMLNKLDEDTLLLKIKSANKSIPVRIGFSYGTLPYIHEICRRFSDEYPNVQVTNMELTDRQCERLLCEHKLDICFVTGPVNLARFDSLRLMDCAVYGVMSACHPLARLHYLTPRNLEGQWIFDGGEEFNIHNEIVRYCEQWKERLQFKAYSLDKLTFLKMVEEGQDILLLPQQEYEEFQFTGGKFAAVPFTNGEIRWTLHAVSLRENAMFLIFGGFLARYIDPTAQAKLFESIKQSETY